MIFKFATSILILLLCSCSSLHSKLRNSQIGMFKRQALSKFGEPVEKYRTKGRDHWVYETQKKSKKSKGSIVYEHTLIFEEGVLIDNTIKRSFTNKELREFYNKP